MNGNWYTWSGVLNGSSGAKYIAAWRHIHDLFVASGATNVVWTWCPNNASVPNETWNDAMNYYPGDTYVDWACYDGYNWRTTNNQSWQTVQQVFGGLYPALVSTGKPIMVGDVEHLGDTCELPRALREGTTLGKVLRRVIANLFEEHQ